jgi:hypothetical protein
VPALNLALTYQDVQFEAKPFKSPQLYGGRLGRLTREAPLQDRNEFIHLKVIGQTSQVCP